MLHNTDTEMWSVQRPCCGHRSTTSRCRGAARHLVCTNEVAPKPPGNKGPKPKSDVHDRLYAVSSEVPPRYLGPIKVQSIEKKGRGVVAVKDIQSGDLLMSSRPIGTVLDSDVKAGLRPEDLSGQLLASSLTAADEQRLQVG